MKSADKFIKVGKFGAPFGIKGWIKVRTYTEYGAGILNYKPWHVSHGDDELKVVSFEEGKTHGDHLIVKLPSIDTPEAAQRYTNQSIYILRSQLPNLAQNEYYWSDLEGLSVINRDGHVFGTVSYLIETGSNDVLVVKGDKEIAIPYLPGKVILEVNLEKGEIIVDWEEL